MAVESHQSSLVWDSTSSPLQFQSSSLSYIPTCYNRSLVAPLKLSQRKSDSHARILQLPPLKLSQRKSNSHARILQLPPLKLRSTLTWRSSEEENFLAQSITSSEHELNKFKEKFDRLRASLSVRFRFFFIIFYRHISIKNRLSSYRYVFIEIAWLLSSIFFLRKSAFWFLLFFSPSYSYIFIWFVSFKHSLEDNRHTFNKAHYKKSSVQQTVEERDGLINQLLTISNQLNDKVSHTFQTKNSSVGWIRYLKQMIFLWIMI